ncbi:U6 snRNA phosphodiesterase Usb1 [Kalaharituber pfeilii]|nr:U6 snRNA phosphodiesterase Usb1 [Kalaharituber pfeilii]
MALNLVDYSDSDSQTDERNPRKRVRTKQSASEAPKSRTVPGEVIDLPPLPSRFHDLYVATPRLAAQDDPKLHGGRQRTVPHEVGNWPSFVFLEWHLNRDEFSLLSEIIRRCQTIVTQFERQRLGISGKDDDDDDEPQEKCNASLHGKRKSRHDGKDETVTKFSFQLVSSLVSDLGTELPLHLSLSRPNTLKTDERAGFVDLLEERIRKAKLRLFEISFTGFEWVSNGDGTRWFFVMVAKSKGNELFTLLRLTNFSFATYQQPPLYSLEKGENGFHVTIGWSLGAPDQELKVKLESEIGIEFKGHLARLKMKVEEVKVKIGNTIKVLPLLA